MLAQIVIYTLSQVMSQDLTGLKIESLTQQQSLKQSAHWYARQRLDWKYTGTRNAAFRECEKNPEKKVFCTVLQDLDKKEKETPSHRSLISILRSFHDRIELRRWIQSGNTEKLATATSSDIRGSLRKCTRFESVEKLVANTLAASQANASRCKYATLNQVLGSKIEEFLPALEAQTALIQLYENAASCAVGDSATKAKYRLSLHYLVKDQYPQALPHLTALASTQNDYQPRALFWQSYCLEKLGNKPPSLKARKTLSEKFPFSFHTLLIQPNDQKSLPISLDSDSEITFRSELQPKLNSKLTVAEALLEIKETKLAKEVLDLIGTSLNKTEPEFRLYLGVLYSRLNQYQRNFQILNNVFKDNPKFITRASLELYYPKNPLHIFNAHKSEVDEKLLLSLIRQESAFNIRARSSVGAMGLMQIMPSTAKIFEKIRNYDRLFDPAFNLKIGSLFFSNLLEKYGGDAELALAAYNAGPRRVDQWLINFPVKNRILFMDLIPFKETRDYVASIARNYYWYSQLYPETNVLAGNIPALEKAEKRYSGQYFPFLMKVSATQEVGVP